MLLACVAACALLVGVLPGTPAAAGVYDVELGGEAFRLEVAADGPTRAKGLAGRESIAADGGMIFVFPDTAMRWFHMRDCLVPIDIVFLDDVGVVTAAYTMLPEKPRADGESISAYLRRLRRYHSYSPSQYVIELRAGTIDRIGLVPGARVMLDLPRLRGLSSAVNWPRRPAPAR